MIDKVSNAWKSGKLASDLDGAGAEITKIGSHVPTAISFVILSPSVETWAGDDDLRAVMEKLGCLAKLRMCLSDGSMTL